jgi:hypothetical protein
MRRETDGDRLFSRAPVRSTPTPPSGFTNYQWSKGLDSSAIDDRLSREITPISHDFLTVNDRGAVGAPSAANRA